MRKPIVFIFSSPSALVRPQPLTCPGNTRMDAGDEVLCEVNEGGLYETSGKADASTIACALSAMTQDLHRDGDLYVLQLRCEALSRMFDDREVRATADWLATQAELIDCGLIVGSTEELCDALSQLTRAVLSSTLRTG